MHKANPINQTNITSIKQYRELKRKLQKYEIDNFDKIYLIPCNGNSDWHELAEHSALIYYYEVCQKLGSKTKFFADTLSFYDQYKIGYIHTLGVNRIRDNLKEIGLYKSEARDGGILIFKLNKTFTAGEIQTLWQQEKARRLKNVTPLEAHNLDPELHQILTALSTRLHSVCNNRLDKLSSHTNGATIIQLITELLANYHRLSMFKNPSPEKLTKFLIKMRKDVYDLAIYIQILGESRLLDLETIASLSNSVFLVRDRIENQLKTIVRKGAHNGTR